MLRRTLISAAAALLLAAATPSPATGADPKGVYTTTFTAANGTVVVVQTEVNDNDLADTIARHRLRVQQAWERAHR